MNDPNRLLQVLTSLIYLHKFSFSSFPIRPYNFPIHLYMSTEHSTNTLQPFMQVFIQSELQPLLSSSRGVLGSHAVYLAPQLLLCTVLLVFPQLRMKKLVRSQSFFPAEGGFSLPPIKTWNNSIPLNTI